MFIAFCQIGRSKALQNYQTNVVFSTKTKWKQNGLVDFPSKIEDLVALDRNDCKNARSYVIRIEPVAMWFYNAWLKQHILKTSMQDLLFMSLTTLGNIAQLNLLISKTPRFLSFSSWITTKIMCNLKLRIWGTRSRIPAFTWCAILCCVNVTSIFHAVVRITITMDGRFLEIEWNLKLVTKQWN
mgnify:CR=1 FL=1